MRKGSLLVTVVILTSVFCASVTTIPEVARASTLFVGGAGPGNFTTIQNAINASNPGDTVFVYNGTYAEHLVVNKPLSLVGENKNITYINGSEFAHVIGVTAGWVNISGFTVSNGKFPYSGIWLSSVRRCNISDNVISDNEFDGILLNLSSENTIEGNIVSSNEYGINIYGGQNNSVSNNTVISSNSVGIYVDSSTNNSVSNNTASGGFVSSIAFVNSTHNVITDNDVTFGKEGLSLSSSFDNIVSYNNVSSNSATGIILWHSSRNRVIGNNVSSSSWGVYIAGSNNSDVINNTAYWNSYSGVYLASSENMTFKENSMFHTGFYIGGFDIENWNSHTIDTSNSVNGRPVYYRKNTSGGTIPTDAGQVILANCTNITVENQNVSDGSIGIMLGFSSGITMSNNTAISNGYYGLSLFESTHNDINSNIGSGSRYAGLFLDESSENNITGNNFSSNIEYGMFFRSSDNNRILSNTASSNRYGIYVFSSNHNTLLSNVVFSNDQDGIHVAGFHNNSISDTNASFNGRYGIVLLVSSNTTITNNTVTSNDQDGIFLDSSDGNNTITHNEVSNNAGGIFLWHSDNNTIDSNLALSNVAMGIELDDSSSNTVSNNTVSNNDYGIHLDGSHRNAIVRNEVSLNAILGFYVRVSSQNHIYHNSILSNAQQAFDDDSNNQWDDGYPSGGNFWSDYTGFDIYSGPDQDRLGSDGIGDTPYVIDFDSEDRYPLTLPYPPQAPIPPFPLSAVLTGIRLENVTLAWELSPDDGGRLNSVVRYDIFRDSSYDSDGLGYQFLGSVPNGTSQFTDVQAGEGDSNNYFYRICSVDSNNTVKCSGEQLGKFTRLLGPGPNLISIPLIQSDESIQTVLQTVSYDNAWSYDSINQEWKSFSKPKPYSQSLEYLNHTVGFWVNVTQDSNLTVAGVVPTSTIISLQKGWNLVGFPSVDDSYTVADLKAAVAVERIEGFDGLAPPYFLIAMADADFFQAGFGYWIRVQSPTIWTVENT